MDERIEENVLKQTAYFVGLDNRINQGITKEISQTKMKW